MIDYSFSYADLEFFLCVMVRILTFVYAAPFFGMNNTPNRVKIGLGFFLAVLVYPTLLPHEALVYNTVLGYATIILKEAATGLLIGLSANICTMIVAFAGRLVDMEIGLTMMTEMDPTTKESTTVTGLIYQYTVMLILLVSGLYQFLIKALVDTFTLIPVNGAVFSSDKLLLAMIAFVGDYIVIGFRISLPVFITITVLNVTLGVLAKVAPQVNMFSVGIQVKMLAGLSMLYLTIGLLPNVANFIMEEMKTTVNAFIGGMM